MKTTRDIIAEQLARMGDSPQVNTETDLHTIGLALDDAKAVALARSAAIVLPTGERNALNAVCRHVQLALDAARRAERAHRTTTRFARFVDSIVIR